MLHEKLTEDIIGAAMLVLNKLKPGLDEKLYERALALELVKRGHKVEQQRAFPVYYDDTEIGTLIPDMIVDDAVKLPDILPVTKNTINKIIIDRSI